jgi:hypothetical protein
MWIRKIKPTSQTLIDEDPQFRDATTNAFESLGGSPLDHDRGLSDQSRCVQIIQWILEELKME